jgi:hypothetical protein
VLTDSPTVDNTPGRKPAQSVSKEGADHF